MVFLTVYTLTKIITVVAFLLTFIYLYFKYCFTYWKKLGVPYLAPKFPYGNFEEAVKATRAIGEVLMDFYREMKAKGHNYFGIYAIYMPAIIIVDPDFIKTVMSRDFGHFNDRGVYHDVENDPLSATLFVLKGQKWKSLRAKLTPTFTSGKLKNMFQTLVDCSLELKDCLNEPISKSEPIDIKKYLAQYTTDVIGSCAFGIECNSFKNPNSEFVRLGKKQLKPSGFDRAKMFFVACFPSVAKFFKVRVTNKEVDYFYRNLIQETVAYREKNNVTRNDFLQLLIQLKNGGIVEEDEQKLENHDKLTMKELPAQAFLFFTAGFETTSSTMTWTMFELSQNQGVQSKVREEIVRVLRKYNGEITYDAVMEMHYLERTVQEALRKFPALMALQRLVSKDYTIPDTNIVLKKGTGVLIPIYAIHRDPEYYPEPDRFDPDRFTEENKATRPDYTWLPFGEGPRICIGLRFAMMQVKVGLCQLLLNYKFTLDAKTEYPPVLDSKCFITTAKDTILLNAQRVSN